MPARPADFTTAAAVGAMAVQQIAADYYAGQAALSAATSAAALAAWAQVEPDRIARSWLRLVLGRVLQLVAAGQLGAAQRVARYVRRTTGRPPVADVVPGRFTAVASDGRHLATLLHQPAITALSEIRDGRRPRQALAVGATQLDMIVRTQVADAGRVATGVQIVATPHAGYVRMLNPPSCARCVILAGRVYRWNAGFQRHPRCDCVHIPVHEDTAGDLRTDPRRYFDSLEETEQNRIFGRAGAQAIRDGAGIGRVVNARRGMYTASVGGRRIRATREGTRRRRIRLMPEQIYAEGGDDRDEALRLLRAHGYLT